MPNVKILTTHPKKPGLLTLKYVEVFRANSKRKMQSNSKVKVAQLGITNTNNAYIVSNQQVANNECWINKPPIRNPSMNSAEPPCVKR